MEMGRLGEPLVADDLPTISSIAGSWYCCGRPIFLNNGKPQPKLTFSCGPRHDIKDFEITYGPLHIKPVLENERWVLKYRSFSASSKYVPVSESRPFILVNSSPEDAGAQHQQQRLSAVIKAQGAYIAHIVQLVPELPARSPLKKPASARPFYDVLQDLADRKIREQGSFDDWAKE